MEQIVTKSVIHNESEECSRVEARQRRKQLVRVSQVGKQAGGGELTLALSQGEWWGSGARANDMKVVDIKFRRTKGVPSKKGKEKGHRFYREKACQLRKVDICLFVIL